MTPKLFRRLALFAIGFITLSFASALNAQTPSQAEILSVQLTGSGCDASRAAVTLSPDLKDLSILFDDYAVEIGHGTSAGNALKAQKNCHIHIDVGVPDGWQFAFKYTDYRGFAALPASAWAFHRYSVVSQGQVIPSMREAQLKGPFNDSYQMRVEIKPERRVWSPCNGRVRRVQLVSQLGVAYYPRTSDRSIAQIVLDSNDTSLQNSFGVEWRRCR